MKFSIEYIKWSGSIDRCELNLNSPIKIEEITQIIKNHKDIIDCKIDDQGIFIWFEIQALAELTEIQVYALIKKSIENYLK